MSPRVSVVMAVHNGLPFLRQAVESILHQTLGDLEFVIVDDGSHDGTWEALQQWAVSDSRIRLLRNERNLGVAEARNRGIAAASAGYLACQDADDEFTPPPFGTPGRFPGRPSGSRTAGCVSRVGGRAGRPAGERRLSAPNGQRPAAGAATRTRTACAPDRWCFGRGCSDWWADMIRRWRRRKTTISGCAWQR